MYYLVNQDTMMLLAEVMSRQQEVAAMAASELAEQVAKQQLAAKQALKQVSPRTSATQVQQRTDKDGPNSDATTLSAEHQQPLVLTSMLAHHLLSLLAMALSIKGATWPNQMRSLTSDMQVK